MSEWIGRVLSKVEIQKMVGRGGMAEVYMGRHTTLNRPVAVKVLQAHLSDDANLLGRFKSEAQAVAAMRHPNIVQVFDFDIVDDRPYMVMELLEGPSLKEYMSHVHSNRLAMLPRTIARLMSSLASALDYAHSRGIIHRDIKPANVMLRREVGAIDLLATLPPDVEPVLTDFGVARIANAVQQTASGTIVGTPAYMSPEQVRGSTIDSRSDIYSLGIMLYEMLSGRVPFSADTQASVLLQQINDPPPPLPPDYAELQPVLDRALAKNPDERFQKATDLSSVLEASLGLPSTGGSTEPRMATRSFAGDDSIATVHVTGSTATRHDVMSPAAQTVVQSAGGINPLWVAGGIAGLALIVGVIALTIVLSGNNQTNVTATPPPGGTEIAGGTSGPAEASATAGPVVVQSVGTAEWRDTSLVLTLNGIEPPASGRMYQAWLTDPEAQPLSLGKVDVAGGSATVNFTSTDGTNLISTYGLLVITDEADGDPVASPGTTVFSGQIDAELVKELRLMATVSGGQPFKTALLNGLRFQSEQMDGHLELAISAITSGDLGGVKTHGEHVVNIGVGVDGPEYGDLNENGRAENPGDDVGLRPYLQMLKEATKGSADTSVIVSVDHILEIVEQAIQNAERITSADTVEEIAPLAVQLEGLKSKNSIDLLIQQAEGLDFAITIQVFPVQ